MVQVCVHRLNLATKPTVGKGVLPVVELSFLIASIASVLIRNKGEIGDV